MTGRLIVLEGGEGAGKSTAVPFIRDWLERQGRKVLATREPGGSPLAEAIRGLALARWDEGIDGTTEALLMFAARAAHVAARIGPALAQGSDVVCDRFVDASWAYQGAGRGVPAATLDALTGIVLGELAPDLTIVFDIDPATGLARTRARGQQNRFESESLAFMQRVREVYLARARAAPDRYAILDAGRDLGDVHADLAQILGDRL